MFRAILFDLDDTLFAHTEAVASGLALHLEKSGCSQGNANPMAAYHRWRELEEIHYNSHLRGEVGFQEQRRLRARQFASDFGINIETDTEADTWFNGFLLEYKQAWSLFHDVLPTLNALQRKIPHIQFGIITNGEKNISWEKMNTLKLDKLMQHTIISGEIGITKPDRRIFDHACQVFSISPEQAIYIGDRLETDAIGANQAGLKGIWLDRSANTNTLERETTVTRISSLHELVSLISAPPQPLP